jgi:hypothetical protein
MAGAISNYREFTAGLIGLVVILGVFLGLAAAGWDGDPDPCFRQPNGCYCENINERDPVHSPVRLRPGWFAQPMNTWSNVGFMLVGLYILWWTGWERAVCVRVRNTITFPYWNVLAYSEGDDRRLGNHAAF